MTALSNEDSPVYIRLRGTIAAGILRGDYRAGDQLWCAMLTPDQFAQAMNRDVLAPMPGGGFLFGRLVALAPPTLLPANEGLRPIQPPAWLALPVRLVRSL